MGFSSFGQTRDVIAHNHRALDYGSEIVVVPNDLSVSSPKQPQHTPIPPTRSPLILCSWRSRRHRTLIANLKLARRIRRRANPKWNLSHGANELAIRAYSRRTGASAAARACGGDK